MISSLNDQLAVRILELVAPKFDFSGVALCWLGMGSEGRSEQTIATDQDNGLIFATDADDAAPDAVRERLLPFARAVNDAMDRCGYPLCKGGVMASNPRWCASLQEWKTAFANWIDRGDPDSLLSASIFFDFRALWGMSQLADALRAEVTARAQGNSRFLKQMSDNALRNRPPLTWLGELQAAEDDSGVRGIDLKMNGSVPFVDAARIFALAAGVSATNTVERLMQAGAARGVPGSEIRASSDAFEYVQLLRLREQHRRGFEGGGVANADNIVPLDMLPDLDRRISRRRYGRFVGCSSASSSTIPDEIRRSMVAALARRPRQRGPRRQPARTLGRRRHETSGLDPEHHPLLAIGAVAVDDNGIALGDSFEIVLKSNAAGDAANIALHGIGHGAQAAGTPAPEALAAFRDWCGTAPRVGFHADFDRAVLRKALVGVGMPPDDTPWLDLAPLAGAVATDTYRSGGRSLDDWLAAFGIECATRHNAAADALATAELLLRLRAIAAKQGRIGFDALLRTARQQKWLGTAD